MIKKQALIHPWNWILISNKINEILIDTVICINLNCMIQRAKIKEFILLYSIHDLTNRKCKKKLHEKLLELVNKSNKVVG